MPDFAALLDKTKDSMGAIKERLPLDKLSAVSEKVSAVTAPIKEKLEPLIEKLPLGKVRAFLAPTCRKCGGDDVRRSERNAAERTLSFVIPVRPYYCDPCDRRFFWFTKPLLDRNRWLAIGAVVLIAGILVANNMVAKLPDEPARPLAQKQVEEAAPTTTDETAGDEAVADSEQSETPDPSGDLPPSVEETTGSQPPEEALPPGAVPEPGEVWSGRVEQQLARNLAKQRGAKVSEPEVKKRRTPPPASKPPSRASEAGSRDLSSLNTDMEGSALLVKLQFSGSAPTIKEFALGNDRYVVDLPGAWKVSRSIRAAYEVEHPLIKRVRIGRHADYFRLVFDLQPSSKGIVPSLVSTPEGAVIRIESK